MHIDYYYSLMSPWAYLGAQRFYELQKKYNFKINHFPLDIIKLFSLSGGQPLSKRAEQRKAYRMMELERWQKKLNLPINFTPKYFPPSDVIKASCVILSILDQNVQNQISLNLLKCMWIEEKDIGNIVNLTEVCKKMGLNIDEILVNLDTYEKIYDSLAEKAAKCNVFGSPSYVLDNEVFWGQDRLELLEEKIIENI